MADPVYTNISTVVDIKLRLNDTSTDDDNSFLTTVQYEDFIMDRILADEQEWTLDKLRTNYYRYEPRGLYIFNPYGTSTTDASIFTGEADCTYRVSPRGYIKCTAGTPTATEIVITAAQVDLQELMVDLCMFIAQHRAKEVSIAMGEGSYTPEEVHRKMIDTAEWWRGVR